MNVHRLAGFFRDFRDSLNAEARRTEGRVGILTPGQHNETYFEHAYIARYLGFMLLGGEFPYLPQQVTLLNLLTIGIPAFVITLSRERSAAATKRPFLREVGSFVLRSGAVIGLSGLLLLQGARFAFPGEVALHRTLLLSA